MKLVWGIVFSFWGQAFAMPNWQTQILGDAARLYEPAAQGERLVLNIVTPMDLTDLIAAAENDGFKAAVRLDGGVLSSARLTPDSLRITICHELGHIFGGALRRNVPLEWDGAIAADGLSLLSAEGEADYYATLVCFRNMVEGQDHQAALNGRNISAVTQNKCESAWGVATTNALVCERTALASFDFLNFVMDFPISFERRASEIAEKSLIDEYPSRQCRLDTLVAGSLCRTQFPMQLDRSDATSSNCPQIEARRPACWYHDDKIPTS